MNHLTFEEIDRIAARTRTNGLRSGVDEHLVRCEQCQREVELQRTLRAVAFQSTTVKVSEDFNARLFARLGINARSSKGAMLTGLLGNMFALMTVIGFFGIIVSRLGSIKSLEIGSDSTTLGKIWVSWVEFIRASMSSVKGIRMIPDLGVKPETQMILLSILAALFLVYLIDWLLERKSIRSGSSHPQ